MRCEIKTNIKYKELIVTNRIRVTGGQCSWASVGLQRTKTAVGSGVKGCNNQRNGDVGNTHNKTGRKTGTRSGEMAGSRTEAALPFGKKDEEGSGLHFWPEDEGTKLGAMYPVIWGKGGNKDH